MREERLLQRLRSWEEQPAVRGREDPARMLESVLKHLSRLLNTRQGNVLQAPDYGVPDLMTFLQDGRGDELEDALREVIERYEPRLSNVRVQFAGKEDETLGLKFHVQARLKLEGRGAVFETLLGPDGHIRVTG